MNAAQYEAWWQLHLRAARGERLSLKERAAYEAGARQLDQEEVMSGDLARLQQVRAAVAAAEAECAALRHRRDELDSEMASLEAKLSNRARQLLGVSDR